MFQTRALADDAERLIQYTLADEAFSEHPTPESALWWRAYMESDEGFRPEQMRGVFDGATQVGGCVVHERWMRLGAGRISVACVGAVVTHPAHRRRGVARALLGDVATFAAERGHPLILLDGIPYFYHQFGYVDMFDQVEHLVDGRAVRAAAATPGYATRAATADDAAAILARFTATYGPRTGSFERSLRQQEHRLSIYRGERVPLVATDAAGAVAGYALPSQGSDPGQLGETAAGDWGALLALLQAAAARSETPELVVRVAPESREAYLLSDQLVTPDLNPRDNPQRMWSAQPRAFQHPNAAWQARLVNLPTLLAQALPELAARWRAGLARWQGVITLVVGTERATLAIHDDTVALTETPGAAALTARLTPPAFVQLFFGYRPLAYLAERDGNDIATAARAPLAVLFPPGHTWIPGSDAF